jgi:polar amino acid transport system substrate-binding protein
VHTKQVIMSPAEEPEMPNLTRRPAIATGLVALTLIAAAACSSSSSGGGEATVSPANTGGANSAASLVPDNIKSKGTLLVAADASYAPNEFLGADGTTVQGMDADLAQAIGKDLGLSVKVKNATFDAIIPGLANGRFDLGMSSFTDTKEREKTVNFVTYFSAGTSFFTKAGSSTEITGLDSLCGLKLAVESGTTQEADGKAQSKKCTDAGKAKVDVLSFNDQSQANLALRSGRADVSAADSPVAAYQVKQSHGAFALSDFEYGEAPYGIAVPKQAGTLDQAVLQAVKDLIADGTYGQIMSKWGLTSGAITDPVINGAIS